MFRKPANSVMPVDQWFSMDEYQQTLPDDIQYQWLAEHGSMTQRLSSAGGLPLKVNVITASEQKLSKEEQLFLEIAPRRMAYVREVIMEIGPDPWMFARTVIPADTLKSGGGQLKLLGERPLGDVLFKNKLNSRCFIEVAKITKKHFLYPGFILKNQQPVLWARRSLFLFNNSPLLVQEVFLPQCPIQQPC